MLKHFDVESPKPAWVESAKKCADAFVRLYETYGTFGQYVNVETGKMMVSASCAGAIAIGALTKAYTYFHDES